MLSRQASFLERERAELVVSINVNTRAVLQKPSLYPRQAELYGSIRTVLTLWTRNSFLAQVLDQVVVGTMAYSHFAADPRDAIRAYSLAIEPHDW